jgi:hypothetical protein
LQRPHCSVGNWVARCTRQPRSYSSRDTARARCAPLLQAVLVPAVVFAIYALWLREIHGFTRCCT